MDLHHVRKLGAHRAASRPGPGWRKAFGAVWVVVFVATSLLASSAAFASSGAPAVKNGGTLSIVGVGTTWSSLDPIFPSSTTSTSPFNLVYQDLLTINPLTGQIEPYLATNWKYNAARTSLILTLRKGVEFQDGTPFNAQAVVFNLQRTSSPANASTCLSYFSSVTSIVPQGNYIVVISFNPPYTALPDVLASQPCAFMASPTAVAAEGTNYGQRPVGTSPFSMVSEVAGSTITFARFSHAWQKAHVNTVVFTSLGDDNSAVAAVQSNTAQILYTTNPQDIALGAQAGLHSVKTPLVQLNYIRLMTSAPPFNNIVARRAVASAINAPLITKQLFVNLDKPDEAMVPPSSWAYGGSRVHGFPQYNPGVAASEVASLPGGQLNFTLITGNTPASIQVAEVLQSELQAVKGITVSLSSLATTQLVAAQRAKNFQALFAQGMDTLPDPDNNYYRQFYSTSTSNQENWSNPTFDNLVTEARETASQPQRKKLYLQADELLAQGLPVIPLFANPFVWITNKKVHGVPPQWSGTVDLSGVWLS